MLLIEYLSFGLEGYFSSKNRHNRPSYVIYLTQITNNPNTAQINVQGCIVLTHSYSELNCDQLHNYYNYFHLFTAYFPSSLVKLEALSILSECS